MATTVYAKQKGLNAGLGFSGNFNSGFSPFTTGALRDQRRFATPGPHHRRHCQHRSAGVDQPSVRQHHRPDRSRAAADKTMGDEYKVA